jgi:hypothetical protein
MEAYFAPANLNFSVVKARLIRTCRLLFFPPDQANQANQLIAPIQSR